MVTTLDKYCLVYRLSADNSTAPLVVESKQLVDKDVDIEAKGIVLHAVLSATGSYMAICNDYKQLLLYKRETTGKGIMVAN